MPSNAADSKPRQDVVPHPDCNNNFQEQKILVFAHHRDVMDRLESARQIRAGSSQDSDSVEDSGQRWNGVGLVRIDGEMFEVERQEKNRRFRSDPTCRVALLSIYAASVGLDFSTASIVVFAELPNEVSFALQAEDRAHRRGNTSDRVNVYYLLAKGTSDEASWQRLSTSLLNMNEVHDGKSEEEEARHGLIVDAVVDLEADTAGLREDAAAPSSSEDLSIIPGTESYASVLPATESESDLSITSKEPSVIPASEEASEEDEMPEQGRSKRQRLTVVHPGEIESPPKSSIVLTVAAPSPPLAIDLAAPSQQNFWFEVSSHSGRIHFYQSNKELLGLSLPINTLVGSPDPKADEESWSLCLKIVDQYDQAHATYRTSSTAFSLQELNGRQSRSRFSMAPGSDQTKLQQERSSKASLLYRQRDCVSIA